MSELLGAQVTQDWQRRLLTINSFPEDLSESAREQLSKNGFYYPGYGNALQCTFCSMRLRWHLGRLSTPTAQDQNCCLAHSELTAPHFELHFPDESHAIADDFAFHPETANPRLWQALRNWFSDESIAMVLLNLRSQGQLFLVSRNFVLIC
jgi:hypothetical protein